MVYVGGRNLVVFVVQCNTEAQSGIQSDHQLDRQEKLNQCKVPPRICRWSGLVVVGWLYVCED